MSAASSKPMIIKPECQVKQNFSSRYHDSERAAEIWPSIKQKGFTQSQMKKDLNRVGNTI